MDFFSDQLLSYILLIQRYLYKTCVFIGQEARYLDSDCSITVWFIYGYLFCWTLLLFPSNVDELVRGIAPLVYCLSPWCFYVYVCTNIWILLLFSCTECFFPLFIYHDCVYEYEIFIILSISIQPSKYACISILARQFALFLVKQSPRFSNTTWRLIRNRCPNILFSRFR